MKLKLFIVCLIFCCVNGVAQTDEFPYGRTPKKGVTTADSIYLMGVVKEYCKPDANFSFSISTGDIAIEKDENFIAGKPASFNAIERAKKYLDTAKDPIDRANTYMAIGQNYKKLNRRSLANEAFDSAYGALSAVLRETPNDSAVLYTAANIMISMDRYEEAIGFLDRLKVLSPGCDIWASSWSPMLYMNMGKMPEATDYIDENLKKWPEGGIGLCYNIMLQMYSFMQLAPHRKEFLSSPEFFNQSPDSILDVSRLYELHKKYPADIKWEQFYKGALIAGFFIKTGFYINDSISKNRVSEFLSPKDKKQLDELRVDFDRIAHDKHNHNPAFAYNVLGTIEYLKDDFKKSIKWFEKAIKNRKPKESDSQHNAVIYYDNLITCYLTKGDTTNARKVLVKKIKNKPAIDPIAGDYVSLGYYDFQAKKISKAKEDFMQAVGIDSFDAKAFTGIAACQLMEGQPKVAIESLTKALRINRYEFFPFFLHGIASLQNNDMLSAYYMFKEAYKLVDDEGNKKQVSEIMDRFFVREAEF